MNKKNFAPKVYPINEDLTKMWFVKYYDAAGGPYKKCGNLSKYNTVAEKRKEAARIIKQLLHPDWQPIQPKYNDFCSLLAEHLEYKKPGMELKSYLSYFSILKHFTQWYRLERKRDKQINPAEYIRHLQIKQYHKNTQRNKILVLKGLTQELVDNGMLRKNPFDRIKLKKVKAQSKLPFHVSQIEVLKKYIITTDTQLWDAIEFLYFLYLRPKEIRELKIEDIIFTEWKLFLSGSIAKDDDVIYKAIPVVFRDKLLKYMQYPPDYYIFSYGGVPGKKILGRDNLSKRHKQILQQLNISKRYSFYSWVHTGIKQAAMAGVPIKQLQIQKGHHDLNMFNEYMKDLGVDDCVQLINNFPKL